MQQVKQPQTLTAAEKQAVSTSSFKESTTSGEWQKLVTSSTKRKDPAPPKGLQVQNRFTTLTGEKQPGMHSSKGSGLPLAHKDEFGQRKGGARAAKKVTLEIN